MANYDVHVDALQHHFESFLVPPVSASIDDLALSETARYESQRSSLRNLGIPLELVDLTGPELSKPSAASPYLATPLQRDSLLRSANPNSTEATNQRRLRRLMHVKPTRTYFSSLDQNAAHYATIDLSSPDIATLLKPENEMKSLQEQTILSKDGKTTETVSAQNLPALRPIGDLEHPFAAHIHQLNPLHKNAKAESIIANPDWFPVLESLTQFFSDTTTVQAPPGTTFPSFMDDSPLRNLEARKPPVETGFCQESGLSKTWIEPLQRMWLTSPSQMLLFIEKQMVVGLRIARAQFLATSRPPAAWTFWRRPDTPVMGAAPSNPFNPPPMTSEVYDKGESDLDEAVLDASVTQALSTRFRDFLIPMHGLPLIAVDSLSLAVLHRVIAYWETMKEKIKHLAAIVDTLIMTTSRNEHHTSSPWNQSSRILKPFQEYMSYWSYNEFALPGEELELRLEWIFRLVFRTVVLRHHSVRWHLRRGLFLYRELFSLDQPQDLAMIMRIKSFEEDIAQMDEHAWTWKYRLCLHHYLHTVRITQDIQENPLLFSPVLLHLLSRWKHSPRQKQNPTLVITLPLLTQQNFYDITRKYDPELLVGLEDISNAPPLHQLIFAPPLPLEWHILRDQMINHPYFMQPFLKKSSPAPSFLLSDDTHGAEHEKNAAANQNQTNATSGYVNANLLTSILHYRSERFQDNWSDESDADYPDDEMDGSLFDEDEMGSDGSALTDKSEYEYYESDDEIRSEKSGGLAVTEADMMEAVKTTDRILAASAKRRPVPDETDYSNAEEVLLQGSEILKDIAGLDWSKIDSEIVSAAIEGRPKEELVAAIARRLGLKNNHVLYEIANLITVALMQHLKMSPDRTTAARHDIDFSGAPSVEDSTSTAFTSPFGPEAGQRSHALPVPAAPPSPPPPGNEASKTAKQAASAPRPNTSSTTNSRTNRPPRAVYARSITDRVLSDDEEEWESEVERRLPDILLQADFPQSTSAFAPVYPYSALEAWYSLRSNDPYEGSTSLKLKMSAPNLTGTSTQASASLWAAAPSPPTRLPVVDSATSPAAIPPDDADSGAERPPDLERAPKKNSNTGAKSNKPKVPGITDQGTSVDELMAFIEGPSKKAKKTKSVNQPDPTRKPSRKPESQPSSSKTSVEPVQSAETTKNTPSASNSLPAAKKATSSAPSSVAPAKTTEVPTPDTYPTFWDTDVSGLTEEERTALNAEVSEFEQLLNTSFGDSPVTLKEDKLDAVGSQQKTKPPPPLAPVAPTKSFQSAFSKLLAHTSGSDVRNLFRVQQAKDDASTPKHQPSSKSKQQTHKKGRK